MFVFFQPWPIVEQFLQSLPAGSVGLDVGCGNGKNLQVNRDVFIVASDRYVYTSYMIPRSTMCFLALVSVYFNLESGYGGFVIRIYASCLFLGLFVVISHFTTRLSHPQTDTATSMRDQIRPDRTNSLTRS